MKEMSFLEFAGMRDGGDYRLIDVREADEFAAVHAKGAELFPLSKIQAGEVPAKDEREIFVICRSGGRSAVAAQILEGKGFGEMTNINDGTNGALSAGPGYVVFGE